MSKAVLLAVLFLTVLPVLSSAQTPRLGIYVDQAGTDAWGAPPLFTQTNSLFVVASDLPDFRGFEFRLTIDPSLVVFNVQVLIGSNPIWIPDLPGNWIFGLAECIAGGASVALLEYTYGIYTIDVADALVCAGPAVPPSIPSPAYYDCSQAPQPLLPAPTGHGVYPDGCAVIYPTHIVAAESTTFGAMKVRFDGP